MTTNKERFRAAMRAVKAHGLSCKVALSVLRQLLLLFGGNWEMIEDNMYHDLLSNVAIMQGLPAERLCPSDVTGDEGKDNVVTEAPGDVETSQSAPKRKRLQDNEVATLTEEFSSQHDMPLEAHQKLQFTFSRRRGCPNAAFGEQDCAKSTEISKEMESTKIDVSDDTGETMEDTKAAGGEELSGETENTITAGHCELTREIESTKTAGSCQIGRDIENTKMAVDEAIGGVMESNKAIGIYECGYTENTNTSGHAEIGGETESTKTADNYEIVGDTENAKTADDEELGGRTNNETAGNDKIGGDMENTKTAGDEIGGEMKSAVVADDEETLSGWLARQKKRTPPHSTLLTLAGQP